MSTATLLSKIETADKLSSAELNGLLQQVDAEIDAITQARTAALAPGAPFTEEDQDRLTKQTAIRSKLTNPIRPTSTKTCGGRT